MTPFERNDGASGPAASPELPGLDLAAGLARVGGDQAFYFKLLERFLHTQRANVGAVPDDAVAQRWAQLEQRAHTLRGSAANIGALALEQAAAALELALRDGGVPATALVETLVAAMRVVFDGIEQHLARQQHGAAQATAAPDAGEVAARAAAARLLELLGQYSTDALDYFEDERSHLATILAPDALDAILTRLESYDMDGARALLKSHLS
ncbi:MAG: Hpt domain-containing protein [Pseudomonadota bacterium]